MSDTKTLYDEDFLAWTKDQAEALRSAARDRSNRRLDWENLAEEIESLGTSKSRSQPDAADRSSSPQAPVFPCPRPPAWLVRNRCRRPWRDRGFVQDEPEPQKRGAGRGGDCQSPWLRQAIQDLERYSELNPTVLAQLRATAYTAEQILDDDWFPPEAQG